ncbi:hypothetical protein CCR75_003556 [Bremia lactucae]|uniref:Uncharacterized protein n=1 Tax=Bremia lactucae TaxID=4779 RepID=A0A976IHC9_BRELC|nr:hypothetical protein CCR75_003556 [Bremia lactucae]
MSDLEEITEPEQYFALGADEVKDLSPVLDDAKTAYKKVLRTGDWLLESRLPDEFNDDLAMRRMYQDYWDEYHVRDEGYRLKKEPECRFSMDRIDTCCVPRIYKPVSSLPIEINDRSYCFAYTSSSGISGMRNTLDILKEEDITKTEMSESPDAIGLWGAMFDDIDYYVRRPGIFGMMHDNSLIDMRPYDSRDRNSRESRSVHDMIRLVAGSELHSRARQQTYSCPQTPDTSITRLAHNFSMASWIVCEDME